MDKCNALLYTFCFPYFPPVRKYVKMAENIMDMDLMDTLEKTLEESKELEQVEVGQDILKSSTDEIINRVKLLENDIKVGLSSLRSTYNLF